MSNRVVKPRLFAGLIYGDSERDGESSFPEDLLKEEFDVLDGRGRWKHVCALFGLAMYCAQLFEADLHNILLLDAKIAGRVTTDAEYEALDADLTGKTLGSLLGKVRKLVEISDDAILLLGEALQRRNQLCHGFFFRKANELLTNAGTRRVCADLMETKELFEKAELVSQVVCKMLFELGGIDEDDLRAEVEREKHAAKCTEGEMGA
jgi:hypothetical protein